MTFQHNNFQSSDTLRVLFRDQFVRCRGRIIQKEDFGSSISIQDESIGYQRIDPLTGSFDYWLTHRVNCGPDSVAEIEKVVLPYSDEFMIDCISLWHDFSTFDVDLASRLIAACFQALERRGFTTCGVESVQFDADDFGIFYSDFTPDGIELLRCVYRNWILDSLEIGQFREFPFSN